MTLFPRPFHLGIVRQGAGPALIVRNCHVRAAHHTGGPSPFAAGHSENSESMSAERTPEEVDEKLFSG
jgi:hypothetical protein